MTSRRTLCVLSTIAISLAAWRAGAQPAPQAAPPSGASGSTTPAASGRGSSTNGSTAPTTTAGARGGSAAPTAAPAASTAIVPPPGYVIGPNDVLNVVFWREADLSGDVTVRPDGNISLPLLNDIQAAGRTPEELRTALREVAARYVEDPNPTVVVKQINSRKVFVTGNVMKPGAYALLDATTVLQLISMAGGLKEFADDRNIIVIRTENGRQSSFVVNYHDVIRRRNLKQNIALKSGDTVVVP
jgi:polysaccharide biosynthesis/export protein